MISSQTATFDDPDLYQRAIRAADAEMVVTGKGRFRAELTRIDLSQLWMQRGRDNLPSVTWMNNSPLRASIYFPTSKNQAAIDKCGMEVSPGDILVCSKGSSHHERTAGPIQWGAMSLTPEDLAAAGRALTGRELTLPAVTHLVRPAPALMAQLLELHKSAAHLAKATPILFAEPEVARALEQTLVHVMIRCMTDGAPDERIVGNRRHVAITARLEDLLMANRDRPLYLAEICSEIGVAERTLRTCCEEHLGMGPIRYLWLRRMHLAHSVLNQATPATATVTEIATAHGFWELGRFAVAYRKLFGESPSVTLNRSPVDPPTRQNRPFDLVAA
jgi:AraC-like DNA-binding protein